MTDVAISRTRLDEATKLAAGTYAVRIRPKCGEATIYRPTAPAARSIEDRGDPDPARSQISASNRARTVIRRLATEHRMARMVTLTRRESSGPEDRAAIVREVGLFVRRLRRAMPGIRYIYALELHPSGHGWHAHMLVDRFIPRGVLADAWGLGFVDIRRPKPGGDHHSPAARARIMASYLAKYISKAADDGRTLGRHRYERSQGLTWTEIEADMEFADAVRCCWDYLGTVTWSWWSEDDRSTWNGPLTFVMRSG